MPCGSDCYLCNCSQHSNYLFQILEAESLLTKLSIKRLTKLCMGRRRSVFVLSISVLKFDSCVCHTRFFINLDLFGDYGLGICIATISYFTKIQSHFQNFSWGNCLYKKICVRFFLKTHIAISSKVQNFSLFNYFNLWQCML